MVKPLTQPWTHLRLQRGSQLILAEPLPSITDFTGGSDTGEDCSFSDGTASPEWIFFFYCKFETYVSVISNRNSCCKSDSSNFCCMILVFVKCNCPCTKCSFLIMNSFKITINDKGNLPCCVTHAHTHTHTNYLGNIYKIFCSNTIYIYHVLSGS